MCPGEPDVAEGLFCAVFFFSGGSFWEFKANGPPTGKPGIENSLSRSFFSSRCKEGAGEDADSGAGPLFGHFAPGRMNGLDHRRRKAGVSRSFKKLKPPAEIEALQSGEGSGTGICRASSRNVRKPPPNTTTATMSRPIVTPSVRIGIKIATSFANYGHASPGTPERPTRTRLHPVLDAENHETVKSLPRAAHVAGADSCFVVSE